MQKASNFLALSIREGCKRFAYVLQVSTSENLLASLRARPSAEYATICATKREAQELCNTWNNAYRLNGECLY